MKKENRKDQERQQAEEDFNNLFNPEDAENY